MFHFIVFYFPIFSGMYKKNIFTFKLVIPSTVDLHAVAEGAKKYIVNLNTRICSCGRFQHYEIPCGHAIAVLRYRKLHEADFFVLLFIASRISKMLMPFLLAYPVREYMGYTKLYFRS